MNRVSASGVVIRSTGSWYSVLFSDNSVMDCRLKGVFRIRGIRTTNPIAVGDRVVVEVSAGGTGGNITHIEPRTNYLIRKATKLSKASHIIAANIDQMVILASLTKPRTSTGFIDRLLVTSEAYHIPAIIVFNKTDLYDQEMKDYLEWLMHAYQKLGYLCLDTSVANHYNIEAFRQILINKVTLLSGHSGVGKSAIINLADGQLDLKTGVISAAHSKGMHTTTFAEMFPLSFGGAVIDTPGIKEFGLVEFEPSELGQRFPEFRMLMDNCRFNNCLHLDEPGCAVKAALNQNQIAEFRYMNYLNMMEEVKS